MDRDLGVVGDWTREEASRVDPAMEMKNENQYVERRDHGFWIAESRVSLDSIVYAFLNGQTAESIVRSFPTLSLEQVHRAITFYLAHRAEIDAYLREARAAYEAYRQAARDANPMLYTKLAGARGRRLDELRGKT
ncbi:MAG TPA: DUF433 domain-containing protein [Thermoanaerobaculia bacterium]|jgi:uncharacterized protein (DUF433 family)|nr:DUF433 domain-containing protein [Thermoanaerobaculia bacterium]